MDDSSSKLIREKILSFFYFSFLTFIGVLIVVWIYFRLGIEETVSYILSIGTYRIILLGFLALFNIFIFALRWRLVLESLDKSKKNISVISLMKIRLSCLAVSYITPGTNYGGEVVRPFLLKEELRIPFSYGLASIIIDRIVEGIALGVLLFVCSLFFLIKKSFIWAGLCLLVSLLMGFAFYLLLKKKKLSLLFYWISKMSFVQNNQNNVKQRIKSIGSASIDFFHKSKKSDFWTCIFLEVIYFLVLGIQAQFFLGFVGKGVSLFHSLVARIVATLGGFFPVPASIGFYEGAYSLGFSSIGVPARLGLSFSLICRFFDFISVIFGLIFLLPYFKKVISLAFSYFLKSNGKNYFKRNQE
ncbi:flippase-like domain-containing protein [bacterium]|nr:flippase-like domain-containing protein [bacterium]